jgi:hypothetical protein
MARSAAVRTRWRVTSGLWLGSRFGEKYPHPPVFLEVLILEWLKRRITEVLILVDLKLFIMNAIQKRRDFLEVLILKGVRGVISPLESTLLRFVGTCNKCCNWRRRWPAWRARDAREIICGADVRLKYTRYYSMSGNGLSRLVMSYSNRMG